MFLVSAALGGTPGEFDGEVEVEVEIGRREVRVGDRLVRSLHLGKWPRSLSPGFLQGLMAAGAPMDLSIHLGPIPAEQAARTLEWQKVQLRVGAEPFAEARAHAVAGGGDRPGGRDPAQGRGAARQGAALSLVAVGHAARERRRRAQGDDPAGEGTLRRHARQARQPDLPPARGLLSTLPIGDERRRRVEDAGHVQPREAVPLLAARPRHSKRHPVRHRHARVRPGRVRPLGRDAPERQHRRARKVGFRQVVRNQARSASRPVPWRDRVRDRP